MIDPHYADGPVTLYAGDCIDVMRELPDASVDAVCTDPPYSLDFMGRDWDTHASPKHFQSWCEQWAAEALRVLKPGGHLLAFGGTRTFHRLTAGIEDAGFEIRDSIAWMYGSGFPKSLDVSKAIDKMRDDRSDIDAVRSWLDDRRRAVGMTLNAINLHFGHASNGGGSASSWMSNPTSRNLPTWEQWLELKLLLAFGDDMDAEVWRLNGRKGTPGDAWADREVLGTSAHRSGIGNATSGHYTVGGTKAEHVTITAPATDAAKQWQGWGTALKPSHEPIICARKPLTPIPSEWRLAATVHHALAGLLWLSLSPAKRAATLSTSNPAGQHAATCASALVTAATATSPARSAATDTFSSPATASTFSNIAGSWSAILAALSAPTTTSTTSTASSTTTGLRTLNSLLAPLTSQTTMPTCGCLHGGPSSPARNADATSNAEWANWLHTLSRSVPETAIEGIGYAVSSALANIAAEHSTVQAAASTAPPTATTAAASSSANYEPIVVARKPLTGTVAANVLQHGTGALNIDACRTGTEPGMPSKSGLTRAARGDFLGVGETVFTPNAAGRWPANAILDESQAAALDQQAPDTGGSGRASGPSLREATAASVAYGARGGWDGDPAFYGDRGGASRFFYTAKASTDERPSVDGTSHPTVKPLDLMRWLVKLVTPKGGTVLEPFAGSGTTVEACVLEGFDCIAIEREPSYLPLIEKRIRKPHHIGFDFGDWEMDA